MAVLMSTRKTLRKDIVCGCLCCVSKTRTLLPRFDGGARVARTPSAPSTAHSVLPSASCASSQSFAASLNATHILRVANGVARLSDNLGLSASDFEHPSTGASSAPAASKAAAPAAATTGGGKKGGKKGAAAAPAPAPAKAAPAAAAPAPAAAKSKSKRTTLAYKEQLEYQVCVVGWGIVDPSPN